MRLLLVVLVLAACGDDGAMVPDADLTPDAPPLIRENVHFEGRFTEDLRFAWPGSRITTRISGTEVKLDLQDSGTNFYEVIIDGVAQPPLDAEPGRQTYVLATGLPAGEHDVVVARRTESFVGPAQFFGFPDAVFVPTPGRARMIEFIGDSITCGYGVLGANMSCPFTAATEAETRAWATLTADALDAAHASIAYSGIGMSRNNGGATTNTMPTRYGRTFADDPSSTWDFRYTPDVIVINLGTNDFSSGDPGPPYVATYTAFVQMLREKFPAAKILLATSPMVGGANRTQLRAYLDMVQANAADPDLSIVDIPQQLPADGYGCDYHPSVATSAKMTAALVPAIRAVTGW